MSKASRVVLLALAALSCLTGVATEPPSSDRARSDAPPSWWAFRPLRPAAPTGAGSRNAIDAFISRRLREAGLEHSSGADRRTLIRRLSFDLTGLPPSPDEVRSFLDDSRDDAYERLARRLLDSPRFGERWARHWLDVVRFGESTGFEHNTPWHDAWRYRDWVIHAFNSDLPYDEFVRLQIAGDILRPDDPLAITATGFLACAPYDKIGNDLGTPSMRQLTRQTELGELVGTVSQTFLGLTVDCARCHDHKYDPIPQQDYFRFASALGGVRPGSRPNRGEALTASTSLAANDTETREIETLEARRLEAGRRAGGALATLLASPAHEGARYRDVVLEDRPVGYWRLGESAGASVAVNLGSAGATAHGSYGEGVILGTAALAGGPTDTAVTLSPGSVITVPPFEKLAGGSGFTVELWIRLDGAQSGGYQNLVGDGESGDDFTLMIYLAGRRVRAHLQTTGGIRAVDSVRQLGAGEVVHVVSTWDSGTGGLELYLDGSRAETNTTIGTLPDSAAAVNTDNGLFFGADRRGTPGPAATLDEVAIYDRPLPPSRIALHASAGGKPADDAARWDAALEEIDDASRSETEEVFEIEHALGALRVRERLAAPATTHAVTSREPEVFRVLERGDFRRPGAVVAAGGLTGLDRAGGPESDFGLAPDAPEGERRRRLAAWITDARNPLLARVIVNRLWQYHFGVGLVATPNDFGVNGARPSHPELLDWLASRLIESGWRLKSIHELIVTSATYRQQSLPQAAALRVDAGNRLLWRMNPRRLEGEALRDSILHVSGRLNPRVGGPSYLDYDIERRGETHIFRAREVTSRFQRRSIYRMWARSGTSSFLAAFDCPDTAVRTPRRALTTTPLQALALLNSPFIHEQSVALARRVRHRAGEAIDRQIEESYRLVFQRAASPDEIEHARPFIREHGLDDFCLVLLNTNEFLHAD